MTESGDSSTATTGIRVIASMGYAARGVVYLVLAFVTALAAIGSSQPENSRGALEVVFTAPMGRVLLVVLAVGLCAYAVWRLCQAFLDADSHGRGPKALVVRIGLAFSALTHLALAGFAASLMRWLPGGDADNASSGGTDWTVWLLDQPYGPGVMGMIAACIAGAGVAVAYKGASAGFRKWVELKDTPVHWLSPVLRFGLVVRGLILLGSGVFLGVAAWRSDASDNRGLEGLLELLQEQTYGVYLLGASSLGLLAFATYSLVEAAYRDIQGLDEW